jgi:hypothetical protein
MLWCQNGSTWRASRVLCVRWRHGTLRAEDVTRNRQQLLRKKSVLWIGSSNVLSLVGLKFKPVVLMLCRPWGMLLTATRNLRRNNFASVILSTKYVSCRNCFSVVPPHASHASVFSQLSVSIFPLTVYMSKKSSCTTGICCHLPASRRNIIQTLSHWRREIANHAGGMCDVRVAFDISTWIFNEGLGFNVEQVCTYLT